MDGEKISIHAPLAGCDQALGRHALRNGISIHAPLAGCDRQWHDGGANKTISIHAPLAGCDVLLPWLRQASRYFNPRTPCGVRPKLKQMQEALEEFQSTHPLRGATVYLDFGMEDINISIHAPLAGCDAQHHGGAAR